MPKVLPEYLELRKQQIVDAAAACFARAGFHQTTMQDICAEADLSPGAVYRYFRSKEEIIQAMCQRGSQGESETMRSIQALGDTQAIFDELARVYLENVADHEFCALSIELLAESRRDPVVLESVAEGFVTAQQDLAEIVRGAQQRGEMHPGVDADAMGRVLTGLYQGLIWQKVLEPDLDTAPYAQAVRQLLSGLFVAPPSAPTTASPALRH